MAGRRKNGTGTIRERSDGRWEGRIVIGYNDEGTAKTKSVFAPTRAECSKKLNQLIEAYQLTRFDRPVNQAANSSLSRPRTDQRHQQHQTAALVESRRPTQKKQPQKAVRQHTWLPVASGIGSVGILEVLRRMYLK